MSRPFNEARICCELLTEVISVRNTAGRRVFYLLIIRRTVMDIKEIALRLLAEEFPGMHQENQAFMVEFAEAIIESYKAEFLKEVGEPTCWMTPDGEGWRMRTKPPETDTKLGWMEFYTFDQVAASQLREKQLREALEAVKPHVQCDPYAVVIRALSIPRDTSALDAIKESEEN